MEFPGVVPDVPDEYERAMFLEAIAVLQFVCSQLAGSKLVVQARQGSTADGAPTLDSEEALDKHTMQSGKKKKNKMRDVRYYCV